MTRSSLARWWAFIRLTWWPPIPEIRSRRSARPSRFQPRDQK